MLGRHYRRPPILCFFSGKTLEARRKERSSTRAPTAPSSLSKHRRRSTEHSPLLLDFNLLRADTFPLPPSAGPQTRHQRRRLSRGCCGQHAAPSVLERACPVRSSLAAISPSGLLCLGRRSSPLSRSFQLSAPSFALLLIRLLLSFSSAIPGALRRIPRALRPALPPNLYCLPGPSLPAYLHSQLSFVFAVSVVAFIPHFLFPCFGELVLSALAVSSLHSSLLDTPYPSLPSARPAIVLLSCGGRCPPTRPSHTPPFFVKPLPDALYIIMHSFLSGRQSSRSQHHKQQPPPPPPPQQEQPSPPQPQQQQQQQEQQQTSPFSDPAGDPAAGPPQDSGLASGISSSTPFPLLPFPRVRLPDPKLLLLPLPPPLA